MMGGMSSFGGGGGMGGGSFPGSLMGGAGGFTVTPPGGGFGGGGFSPPVAETPLPEYKPLDLSTMPKPRVGSADDFAFITNGASARPTLNTPGLDPWSLPTPSVPQFRSNYQTPPWMQGLGTGGFGQGQDVGVGGDRPDVGVGEVVGPTANGWTPGYGPNAGGGGGAAGGTGGAVGITPAGSQLLQMQREQLTLQQKQIESELQNQNNQYQTQLAQLQQSQAFHGDDTTVRQQTLELQNQWENQKTLLQRNLAELQSRQNDLDRGLHQQEINNQFQTQMGQLQQQGQQFGMTNELEQRRLLLQDQWQKASNDLQETLQGRNADLQKQLQQGTLGFQYKQLETQTGLQYAQLGSEEQRAREANQLQRELQGSQLGLQYTQLGTQTGLAQQAMQNQNQQSAQDRQLAMYNSALRNPWMQNLTGLTPQWNEQGGPAQTGYWSSQGQPTQAPGFNPPTVTAQQTQAPSTANDELQPSSGLGGMGTGQDTWRPKVGRGQGPGEDLTPARESWRPLGGSDPEPTPPGGGVVPNRSAGGVQGAYGPAREFYRPIDPMADTAPYRPTLPPASDVPPGPTMRGQLQDLPYEAERGAVRGSGLGMGDPGSVPVQRGFFGRNNPFGGGGMGANTVGLGLDVLYQVFQSLPQETQDAISRAPQGMAQAMSEWVRDHPMPPFTYPEPDWPHLGGGQDVGAGADNNFDFGSIAGGMSPSTVANMSSPMMAMGNGSGSSFGNFGFATPGGASSGNNFNFGGFGNQYQQGVNSVGPLQPGGGFQSAPLFTPPRTPNAYNYQDWANLNPFQRAATRTQTEMSGKPWEQYNMEMRDWWGAANGVTRMPEMSQLQAARQDPMQQLGTQQMLETFGTSPQQYQYEQQRRWSPAQASGAQLQA